MIVLAFALTCCRWLLRIAPAAVLLIATFAHAKAAPRRSDHHIPRKAAAVKTVAAAKAPAGTVEQLGLASWYGAHWQGRKTASGDRFDAAKLTAASLTLPLKTHARVVNLKNGRSVDVVVNDRGPYVKGRIMDLSAAAATALGMRQAGLTKVAIYAHSPAAG